MANDEKRFCIAYASGLVDQLLMEKSKWNGSKSEGTHCEQGVKVQKGQDTSKGHGTRSMKELIFTQKFPLSQGLCFLIWLDWPEV